MKREFTKFMAAFTLLALLIPFTGWGQAPVNTVLWGETWTDGGNAQPSNYGFTGTTVYGNATLTYANSSTNTKLYNENSAGGTAPELLLSKNNQTWTISGIPTGSATGLTLTFKANYDRTVVSSTTSGVTIGTKTFSNKTVTYPITIASGVSTFTLVFTNTDSNNVRIDNIELVVTTAGSGGGQQLTPTTTTITAPQNFNNDLYVGTTAGTLTAAVTETGSGNAISGATVTWASTDTNVATVDQTGAVTLVAVGTTNITATYAGDQTYATSSGTYQLTVVDNTPSTGTDVTFTAGTDTGSSSMTKSNVTISSTNAVFTYNPYRIYTNAVTTISVPAGYTITKVVINGANGYDMNKFTANVGAYSVNSNNVGTWTGNTSSVEFTNTHSAQLRVNSFVVTIESTGSTPTISASPSTLNTFSYLSTSTDPSAAQQVSVSGANLSADITVSVGANSAFEMCTTENGTYSDNDITLQHASGVVSATNIYVRMKANQTGNPTGTLTLSSTGATSVTIALNGSVVTPMSVADAIDAIDNAPNNQVSGAYVLGIISEVVSYQSNYNSITYWISDDGESNVLQVYSGLGLNGAPFSALTDLSVGDEVVVYGNLKLHNNSVYEFDYNNYLVSYTAHQAQQFTLAVTSVSNATIDVFDATDPDETNWVWLFDGVGSDQVTEGTQIGLSVIANNGYAIEHLMVNNVDHAADITSGGTYTFNMPAQNVTITVTTVPAYTISFYVNGSVDNTLEMTIPQAAGATLGTLPTPAVASIPTGFEFCGWMVKPANDYYSASTAPTMVNGSTAVSADMDLAAVFAQTDNSNLTIGELTATEIADEFANGNHAYADPEVEYEDGDFTWAAMYSANNGRHWIQLKNDAGVYLKIEAPSNIQSVEVVISNSSNQSGGIDDITMHGNYDATGYIYLNTTNGGTHVGTTAGSAVVNNHATIVPSGNNTTLYLQVDKSARIWGVTVSCGQLTYVDYTTLVVNHADNTTIADNAAETLYGIHYINGYVLAGHDVTNSGKLIITANGQLDMDAYTLTNATAANLIIEDGAQVICGNDFEGTMLKDITAYEDATGNAGYYIFASPIENLVPTAANGFVTQNYDLYAYNGQGDGNGNEWINFKDNNNGLTGFAAYRGYLYASGQNTTLRFAGTLNDPDMNYDPVFECGVAEIELDYGSQLLQCFTLVGNSLTYQVEYETDDPVNFLVLNEDGDQFVIESEGETEITLNPMEAVLVYSTAENYFHKPGFAMSPAPESGNGTAQNVNVKVSRVSGSLLDNAIMSFNGSMMRKLYLSDNSTRVYFPVSNEDYAVVPAQLEGEQPVNFKAKENGTYVLSVELNNVELSYLHLIDNMTGADVDLLATPSYTFEAKTTDYASRFRLVFSAEENGASTGSATFAFFNGSEWVVSNTGEATLQVVDVMGRVLSSETVNGNTTISLNQVPGVYMLRLVNGDNVQVQKIVVR